VCQKLCLDIYLYCFAMPSSIHKSAGPAAAGTAVTYCNRQSSHPAPISSRWLPSNCIVPNRLTVRGTLIRPCSSWLRWGPLGRVSSWWALVMIGRAASWEGHPPSSIDRAPRLHWHHLHVGAPRPRVGRHVLLHLLCCRLIGAAQALDEDAVGD
jgi:hypothetical protein